MLKHACTQFISVFFIALVNLWLIYKHVKGNKDYTYHSYLHNLAEALEWAGGHHQKQEHPRTQLSKPCASQLPPMSALCSLAYTWACNHSPLNENKLM